MRIVQLDLTNFRCFSNYSVALSPNFTVFTGDNGCGKTSLLEAIYYLGFGKSFRTHLLRRVIQRENTRFSLFSRIKTDSTLETSLTSVGIRQSLSEDNCIRINGENADSRAVLLDLLPVQLINTESYRLIDSGPESRREFLDWGVFHVKHNYLATWRQIKQSLRQRNAALKSGFIQNITVWDDVLVGLSEKLTCWREEYFQHFLKQLSPLLNQLLPELPVNLKFYQGWSEDVSLKTVLNDNLNKDRQLGYTSTGPQRADIRCRVNGVPADDFLSRGQQKLLVVAMRLAQGLCLREKGKEVIYLLDDIAAELDAHHRSLIIDVLKSLNSQIILTAIDMNDLSDFLPEDTHQVCVSASDVSRETV